MVPQERDRALHALPAVAVPEAWAHGFREGAW